MKDVFFFNSMLTPKIITVVYWLLLISVIISGLGTMFTGFAGFWQSLVIIVFGCIGVRIWCELLIVLFKINDNLKNIADKE
ncbi:DUF4282 domain-containing protein [Rheinheimera salexigens]|uniref:DUF4282 domain-containing protein n=1 Tax=Rheinheimera salexigens TaxID=1628148 RepID=A0A1E7Q9J9_9GAMM|nr:DUF4282 domain-containing protein [Rheinheimera salexigens]OEY70864.1 hypothetical protein BI198_15845 [Rheinheimera salexigens]